MNMVLVVITKVGGARKIRGVTDVTINLTERKIVYKQGHDYIPLQFDDILQIQTYPISQEKEWGR
jgi:hypothetical protein